MRAQDARIAIYGAGAMGTVLGVMLKQGGLEQVDLITRNEAHVQGMRENGATVLCEADGVELNEKVHAILPSEMSGQYDLIFLMTKQRYNTETLTALSVSSPSNPAAKLALDELKKLKGCEMHLSHIPPAGDENALRKLAINVTSDPRFTGRNLLQD